MHFAIGLVIGVVLTFPRITPEVRYWADGQSRWYHADDDCTHGAVIPFGSRKKAEAAKLTPCPVCVSPRLRDEVADSNGRQSAGDSQQNVEPISIHRQDVSSHVAKEGN